MDRLTDDTCILQEMEQPYPGKEALNEVESAVLRVKKCINEDAKTNDVFSNLRESFWGRKHYIQWGESPNVKLQMQSGIFSYKVSGTNAVTDKCEFFFISVNGREMDNIYYIRSAHWEDYYMRMSENGSCDAVKNKHEKGGKWKFVPLDINQSMFIISSVDWPWNFLYLEADGWSVKGESDLQKVKVNGLWKIVTCKVNT